MVADRVNKTPLPIICLFMVPETLILRGDDVLIKFERPLVAPALRKPKNPKITHVKGTYIYM